MEGLAAIAVLAVLFATGAPIAYCLTRDHGEWVRFVFESLAIGLLAQTALGIVALTTGNIALAAFDASTSAGWRSLAAAEFRVFWIVAAVALLAVAAGLFVPAAHALLGFERPPVGAILLAMAAAAGVAAVASWRRRGPTTGT